MILKLFVFVGALLVAGMVYGLVQQGPTAFQAAPANSGFADYVASGRFPDPDSLLPNSSLGHDVFEEPDEDAVRLKAALESMAQMGDGGSMQMGDASETMQMGDAGETMQMDDAGETMQMGDAGETMQMDDAGDTMQMGDGVVALEDDAGGAGLRILASGAAVDREIEIVMTEWSYSPGRIDVKPGERVLLKFRNEGNIPHEFMFMTMPAMMAVGYRIQRADWNLLEHEALYEQPLILPGTSFEVAVEIQEAGAWMFMCMFPFHMQFGMMGGLATAGMSMNMQGM